MSDETPLEKSRTIAIAALNECQEKHGLRKIMNCAFCVSLANEMTIARHFEPILSKLDRTQSKLDTGRKGIQEYLDGDYPNPRAHRPRQCPHERSYYEDCGSCDAEHFIRVLEELSDD